MLYFSYVWIYTVLGGSLVTIIALSATWLSPQAVYFIQTADSALSNTNSSIINGICILLPSMILIFLLILFVIVYWKMTVPKRCPYRQWNDQQYILSSHYWTIHEHHHLTCIIYTDHDNTYCLMSPILSGFLAMPSLHALSWSLCWRHTRLSYITLYTVTYFGWVGKALLKMG